jgi:hypothetical protein
VRVGRPGLTVCARSNGILNNTLYDQVTFKGLLSFQRVIAASRATDTADAWVRMFERFNAGTCAAVARALAVLVD